MTPRKAPITKSGRRAVVASRFAAVLERLQAAARASGADKMTDEEIAAEIAAARAERKRSAP